MARCVAVGSQPVSVMIAVSPSDILNPVSLLSRIMCRKNTIFGASTFGSPAYTIGQSIQVGG
jgi:hypothetical protein